MGAWGYKFDDNDSAGDLLDVLNRSNDAVKIIEKILKSGDPEEMRVVAHFLTIIRNYMTSAYVFDDHIARAEAALQDLIDNKDWIDSWDNPPTIKKELKKELMALRKYFED
jgi:hypothetical protein